MILHSNIGPTTHKWGKRTRRFTPKGHVYLVDNKGRLHRTERQNPDERYGSGGLSARIFIGLNVGDKPTYKVQDVVDAVIKIRRSQKVTPDASFLAQTGIYTDDKDHTITEESVQVIIIDTVGTPKAVFEKELQDMCEKLAAQFKQERVILEIQERGVVQDVYSVTP